MLTKVSMSRFDLVLLLVNVVSLGALLVLMVLRGPTPAIVWPTLGAAAMAIGTIGSALTKPAKHRIGN
jgi:hypothetical protein